jgi:uncharacterized protein YjdB
MVIKKLMVGCLVASVLMSGSSAVMASPVEVGVDSAVEVQFDYSQVPSSVGGDVHLEVPSSGVTAKGLENVLSSLKVLNYEGAELSGYTLSFCKEGGKVTHYTVEEAVEYINNKLNSGLETAVINFYAGGGDYDSIISTGTLIVSINDTGVIETPVAGNVVYSTHVQNVGWQGEVADGEMSGTEGKSLRLEGITIKSGIEGLGVSYATHVQNIGWQSPVADGVMSGTEGLSYRLEAIRINLTGEQAENYDVYYRVHAQNVGWMGWASNGADSGTAGYGYRLEGIEIQIVEKGAEAPGTTEDSFRDAADEVVETPIDEDTDNGIEEVITGSATIYDANGLILTVSINPDNYKDITVTGTNNTGHDLTYYVGARTGSMNTYPMRGTITADTVEFSIPFDAGWYYEGKEGSISGVTMNVDFEDAETGFYYEVNDGDIGHGINQHWSIEDINVIWG